MACPLRREAGERLITLRLASRQAPQTCGQSPGTISQKRDRLASLPLPLATHWCAYDQKSATSPLHKALYQSGVTDEMVESSFRGRVVLLGAFFAFVPVKHALAADWPSEVVAHYDVNFAGFNIGSFKFRSEVGASRYSLAGEAKVSAVFGAFKWQGHTSSSGRAGRNSPRPRTYAFDYRSNSKKGSVRMAFKKGHIIRNEVVPHKPYSRKHAPLRAEHLKGVFDPISAVMALTRVTRGHPCQRRIPIFDGKQRFDLVLSPAGRERVREARPSGQPEMAYVCRVKYVPIGGYKKSKQTKYMVKNNGMRLILRAVPSAKILIPYQVRVPTVAGEAVLTSRSVNIITAKRRRIALIH